MPLIEDDVSRSYQSKVAQEQEDAIIEDAANKVRAASEKGPVQLAPIEVRPEGVEPEQEPQPGTGRQTRDEGGVLSDIGQGLVELPRATATGMLSAGQEVMDSLRQLSEFAEQKIPLGTIDIEDGRLVHRSTEEAEEEGGVVDPLAADIEFIGDPESQTGKAAKSVVQFLTGFIPVMRATKSLGAAGKAGQIAQPIVAGSIADPLVMDEQMGRVSNLVQDVPALENPVTEFLAADEGDSIALGKLKQGLEGAGLGAMEGAITSSLRVIRNARRGRRNVDEVKEELRSARAAEGEASELPQESIERLGSQEAPAITIDDEISQAADDFLASKPGEIPDRVANINLRRIGGEEDVRQVIADTAKLFEDKLKGERQGFEQTKSLANEIALDPNRVRGLLTREEGAFTAQEVTALRFLLTSSGKALKELASQAATAGADDVAMFAFRRQMAFHNALQQQVSGAAREAGRALGSFNIISEGTRETDKAIREIIESSGGRETTRRMAQMLNTIDSAAGRNVASRQMAEAKTSDMLLEAWINGLLSNPQTHVVNMLGNSLAAAMQPPERWLAGSIRRAAGGTGVDAGEAVPMMRGAMEGTREGLRLALKALRTGEPSDAFSKLEMRRDRAITGRNVRATSLGGTINRATRGSLEEGGVLSKGVDLLGETLRVPGRALLAGDELWKSVGYRMELHARAFRNASREGLEGDAFASRYHELVNNPDEAIRMAATDSARYTTFTQPLEMAGRSIQTIANSHPAAKVILPFVRTPANIMKFVGERSPAAPLMRKVRADIAAGGERRDLAMARIGMGSYTMAAAADMAQTSAPVPGSEGLPYMTMITGGGPADPDLKGSLRSLGWQPYSFWAGDKYVSFVRLDPLGATFGIAADMAQIMGQTSDAESSEMAAATIMAVSNNITSKTWLRGAAEFFDIISEGVSSDIAVSQAKRFGLSLVGSTVPAGVAQAARLQDPVWRSADDVVQQIKSRIPGMSEDIPPNLNLWGEPIMFHGGWGPDVASPLWASPLRGANVEVEESEDGDFVGRIDGEEVSRGASVAEARWDAMIKAGAVEREMIRNEVTVGMPQRKIRGVELDQEQYNQYVKLAGNELKDPTTGLGARETIDALIQGRHPLSGMYQNASDGPGGGKSQVIRSIILSFREAARAEMLAEDQELADKVRDLALENQ